MGGFGAFDIARQEPFSLIGGEPPSSARSAATRPRSGRQASETAPGAFDDEADFEAHDVIALVGPTRIAAQRQALLGRRRRRGPLRRGDRALVEQLRRGGAQGRLFLGEGGHESTYWRSNWRRYMHFYARALKKCQQTESEDGARDESGGSGGREAKRPGGKQDG